MPNVVGKQYTMERRTFLKLSAAAAAAGVVVDFEAAAAEEVCKEVKDVESVSGEPLKLAAEKPDRRLLYWIDGPMNTGLPGYDDVKPEDQLLTRARLSVTMTIPHNDKGWLESVTLAEGSTVIAQNFYGKSAGTVTGNAPYTVFENLDLDATKDYKVIYVHSDKDEKLTAYVHTISKPEPSRFDYKHLSYMSLADRNSQLLPDLAQELEATNQYHFQVSDAKNGYITTPYGVTQGGPHTCRAKIVKIEGLGAKDGPKNIEGDFQIEVEFMHGGEDDAHYMRYFLVLDPVGRILGGVRRHTPVPKDGKYVGDGLDVAGKRKVLVKRGFHTPLHPLLSAGIDTLYTYNGDNYGRLHGKIQIDRKDVTETEDIKALDDKKIAQYITSMNILDCPFVTIYTDDRFHAIARYCLRLR